MSKADLEKVTGAQWEENKLEKMARVKEAVSEINRINLVKQLSLGDRRMPYVPGEGMRHQARNG